MATLNAIYWSKFPSKVLPNNKLGKKWASYIVQTLAFLPVDRRNEWLNKHAPWLHGQERARLLIRGAFWHSDEWLGEALELSNAERTERRIRTIRPNDLSWDEVQLRRKEKDKMAATKRRRANGARPRAEYEANSLSQAEPWKLVNMTRSTWYRHGKPTPEDVRQVHRRYVRQVHRRYTLDSGDDALVSADSPQGQVVMLLSALPKGSHGASGQPQSQCQGVSIDGCFWKKIEYPPLTNLYRVTVPIAPTLSMAA
jgi:hypothetical protein